MAGTPGNQNAVDNSGGKTLQDRNLAAEVRRLSLSAIKKVLEGKDSQFRKAVILKLAGTVLPRLTEVSGPDGDPISIGVVMLPTKNASSLDTTTETGDSAHST